MYRYVRHLDDHCASRDIRRETVRMPAGSGPTTATFMRPREWRRGVVLVYHSLGADRHYPFTELFEGLLDAGVSVLSVDVDGHGIQNEHRFAYPEILDAAPAAVEFLERRYGVPGNDVILLGHSLGGAVCLRAACDVECRGVIVVSGLWRLRTRLRAVLELASLAAPCVRRQLEYYSLWDLAPAFAAFKRREFPCRTSAGKGSYLDDVAHVLECMSIPDAVRKARSPLLQIHGKLDMIVPVSQAIHIDECYGGPAETVLLPWHTHFTTLFSRACTARMAAWVTARLGS